MQPIWLPQLNPATLIVTAAPEGFAARSLPDPATLSIRGEPSSDGLHGVVEDVQGDLGVWEGRAQSREIGVVGNAVADKLAPKLATALFTGFPGESGRTIEVK